MNIKTPTEAEVRSFYKHPQFSHVKQDGGVQILDMENHYWLLFMEEGEPIGLGNFVPRSSICLEAHPFMFKQYRRKFAVLCVGASFAWFKSMRFHKMVVEIPENMPGLVNFAKRFGFTEEGINRESVKKNGKILDRICLGITVPEMANYLQEAA